MKISELKIEPECSNAGWYQLGATGQSCICSPSKRWAVVPSKDGYYVSIHQDCNKVTLYGELPAEVLSIIQSTDVLIEQRSYSSGGFNFTSV